MTPRSEDFVRRVCDARSDIEAYKIFIAMQSEATPQEIAETFLATHKRTEHAGMKEQLRNLMRFVFPDAFYDDLFLAAPLRYVLRRPLKPQRFEFSQPAKDIFHFRSNGAARHVVFAFCGSAQLLFGPVARVLQYFPSEEYDFVVLRDPRKLGFSSGIPGIAGSFPALIEHLQQNFVGSSLRQSFCLGTSGGGGPALTAAVMLGAQAGISFSGRMPTSSGRYGDSRGALEMSEVLAAGRANHTRLSAVFGADNQDDRDKAGQLQDLSGATAVEIPECSGHNVLHFLHLQRKLGSVLRNTGILTSRRG